MLIRFNQLNVFCLALLTVLLTSCSNYKNLTYFNDLSNTADTLMRTQRSDYEVKIKTGDLLTFTLTTLDQLSNPELYQAPVPGNASLSKNSDLNLPTGSSYLVDKAGNIELPLIGKAQVAGLTLDGAKDVLRAKYAEYYKSFSLNLNFLNHYITVLGEVANPGTFNISSANKITIFDALGYAGDITVFGKKENVLLIRDSSDNQKHIVRLDLNSKRIVSSPYFFMKENDMLYVEPGKNKLASTDAYRTRYLTFIATGLSILFIALRRL